MCCLTAAASRSIDPSGTETLRYAPEELKGKLLDSLTVDQKIFRDTVDRRGRTALHIAGIMDRDTVADVLLGLGADPGLRDESGCTPLQYMITNIPLVAGAALAQFHQIDRPSRSQTTFIRLLEANDFGDSNASKHRTVLEEIVNSQRLNLVVHPAIEKLVTLKWDGFAKRMVIKEFALYLFFLGFWTASALAKPDGQRNEYDLWRAIVEGLGVLQLMYYVYGPSPRCLPPMYNPC